MKQARVPLSILLLGVVMASATTANGAEIYTWVGPDGVTHFTETRPPAELAGVEVLELDRQEPAVNPARDYRSILAVAKDMEASRLERERLRLEKQKLLLEARQARDYATGYTDTRVYYPLTSRYLRKPHRRYWHGRPRAPMPRHGHRGRQYAPPQGRVYLER